VLAGWQWRTRLKAPLAPYRSLTWRAIQSTEARTPEATMRMYFHPGQGLIDGALTGWTAALNTIDHGERWSVPPAWP
jgi:hypothetical protein